MNRIMAPFAAPTKAPVLQGKRRRVRGSVSFGGSNGLLCLSSRREKYCHKGGMALAHHGVGLPSGSTMAIMAPSGGPQKTSGLQGKCRRVRARGSVPFGGSSMRVVAALKRLESAGKVSQELRWERATSA